MTTVLDKQKVETITIYSQGKYKTVKKNGLMYLVLANSNDQEEVIASFTPDKKCRVYNVDLANCWLSENTQEHRKLEKLTIEQLQEILVYWLDSDLNELMTFDNIKFDGELKRIFDKFTPVLQKRILEGLEELEVRKDGKFIVPYMRLTTVSQMEWASKKLYPFAKLSSEQGHYDICKRTIDGGYVIAAKNGNCGSFKKFEKDKNDKIIIIFDKPVKSLVKSNNIMEQINNDLRNSTPYQAANKFVKLEEKLIKEFDNLVETVTNQVGFIDSSTLDYPNIDEETSTIASLIRKAQKVNEPEKSTYIFELSKVYEKAYSKLEQSKTTLEELYKKHGIIS